MREQQIVGAGDADFHIQYLATDNAATAVVEFDGLAGSGDSKRNKGEVRDVEIGADLAIGRAFQDLGREFIDRAYERLDSRC